MQLAPLSASDHSHRIATRPNVPGRAQAAALATAPQAPASKATKQPLPRQGMGTVAPELNGRVAGAQQALAFLDDLSTVLQDLKSLVSHRLADRAKASGPLAQAQQRLVQLWDDRAERSGHSLDGQLAYSADAPARQRFRLRGLDARTVATAGPETVAFSLTGTARQAMTARLEPHLPPEAQARRLDQALAPAGIRVQSTAQGGFELSVAEAEWPRVRDQLAIKGEGRRFATGQFVRVQPEPVPAILTPERWELSGSAGLRESLLQILRAEQQGRQTRAEIDRSLAATEQALAQSPAAQEAPSAQSFAAAFAQQAEQADYALLATLSPSLMAMHRPRIDRLLALS